jgi:hypothetical protein
MFGHVKVYRVCQQFVVVELARMIGPVATTKGRLFAGSELGTVDRHAEL